jgi:hypothetical protein
MYVLSRKDIPGSKTDNLTVFSNSFPGSDITDGDLVARRHRVLAYNIPFLDYASLGMLLENNHNTVLSIETNYRWPCVIHTSS